jgi:hypothetical protein
MERIRAFTQSDIPAAARLYQNVFGGGRRGSSDALEAYFHEVFFGNPWCDPHLPSFVYERDRRLIVGFLGVMPRRFNFKGRSLKAAVSTQLMVEDGSRNGLAALKLVRAFFSGPQDLSFTDGANESSRRIWKALGGADIPVYSLCWTRLLKPRPGTGPALGSDAARSAGATEAAEREPPPVQEQPCALNEQALEISTVLDKLPLFTRRVALRPEYDHAFLAWLWRVADVHVTYGRLHKRMVSDARGIQGWYVYYLNPGGSSQVLQLVASPDSFSLVLRHLFRSLREQGAATVSGRLDPQYLHDFSREQCRFSAGSALLAQASDSVVLEAIYKGEALLSRLEGEWWNGFRQFLLEPQIAGRQALEAAARRDASPAGTVSFPAASL